MENYLERIDKIVVEDIIPLEDDFLMHGFLNVLPKLNQCREKVKKLGLWTPYLSEEYGGLGLSLLEFANVSEILGKSLLGHYLDIIGHYNDIIRTSLGHYDTVLEHYGT